jgi:hypothetical protein
MIKMDRVGFEPMTSASVLRMPFASYLEARAMEGITIQIPSAPLEETLKR